MNQQATLATIQTAIAAVTTAYDDSAVSTPFVRELLAGAFAKLTAAQDLIKATA